MANEPRRVKWLLDGVTDNIDKCTDWEQSFVRNVEEAFRKTGGISDGRYDTLEKIYAKRCQ